MNLKFRLILVLAFLNGFAAIAVYPEGQSFDHAFGNYGRLLSVHVKSGLVDYEAIQKDPGLLNATVAEFGDLTQTAFSSFSKNQKLAFWINAYNLFTIQAIVDNYPVQSIKDIDGVWDELTFLVVGQQLTLDNIEHDILRKQFDEPRVHVALVCASTSCPELWNRPFTADSIGHQLDLRSGAFVRDSTRNRWDVDERKVYLSKIFNWYGNDFRDQYLPAKPFPKMKGKDGATAHFFYRYAAESTRSEMTEGSFKVKHLKYDWSLNRQ